MSIQKLKFIQRKLQISNKDVADAWTAFGSFAKEVTNPDFLRRAFERDFADPKLDKKWAILPEYQVALRTHCGGDSGDGLSLQ